MTSEGNHNDNQVLLNAMIDCIFENSFAYRLFGSLKFNQFLDCYLQVANGHRTDMKKRSTSIIPSSATLIMAIEEKLEHERWTTLKKQTEIMIKNGCGFSVNFIQHGEFDSFFIVRGRYINDNWRLIHVTLDIRNFLPCFYSESGYSNWNLFETIAKTHHFTSEFLTNCAYLTMDGSFDFEYIRKECKIICLSRVGKMLLDNNLQSRDLRSSTKETCTKLGKVLECLNFFLTETRNLSVEMCKTLDDIYTIPHKIHSFLSYFMVKQFLENKDCIHNALRCLYHGDDIMLHIKSLKSLKLFYEILKTEKEMKEYVSVASLINEFVCSLKPSTHTPTSNMILPRTARLHQALNQLIKQHDDVSVTGALARLAKDNFRQYFLPSLNPSVMYSSAYLDPVVRAQLNTISQNVSYWKANEIREIALKELKKFEVIDLESSINVQYSGVGFKISPMKLDQEIIVYENLNLLDAIGEDGRLENYCPLKFWRKYERQLPTLSRAAKRFLSIPACIDDDVSIEELALATPNEGIQGLSAESISILMRLKSMKS